MLKELKIKHYKGFFEEETIEFAQPDNKKQGSGLTLLVGPNNTGKTSVIEALLIDEQKKFKESERHENHSPIITFVTDNSEFSFTNIDNGSQIELNYNDKPHRPEFELIPSRRYWETYSSGAQHPKSFAKASSNQNIRNSPGMQTAETLKEINKDPKLKRQFNEYAKKIIPHLSNWTIDSNDQNDYVKHMTENASHQTNLLGDGVISVFRICAHLVADEKNRILIIDEPELSLHPAAQKALAKIISVASLDRQVIVCTHSPHFANWYDLINGAKFVRLNKHNDIKCTVSMLDSEKQYSKFIKNNMSDYQKPQLLDTVAKEILFADNILFVEGQEDVGLIRKWLYDYSVEENFDIFGYGVGGYGNMNLFLQIACDLNLSKVGALYDSDARVTYDKDRANFTKYFLKILPTEDIRDKYNSCKKCGESNLAKKGCFDKKGILKDQHKDTFSEIMYNFINYFSK